MFYSVIDDKLQEITLNELSDKNITVAFLSLDELKQYYYKLGFSEKTVASCQYDKKYFFTGLDIYDDYSFGIIKITDVLTPHSQKDTIAMYVKSNLFVFVSIYDEDNSCLEIFEKAIHRYQRGITLEKLVFAVLEELLSGGDGVVEYALDRLRKMEEPLIKNKFEKNTDKYIFSLKNKLMQQKRYYDQLYDFAQALLSDSNGIFSYSELKYLLVYTNEALRLSETMEFLCENAVHLREVYEDNISNNMNKTMKIFTVISAVFLPLTLLVGWYGMNFKYMPELQWEYGYIYVIILSMSIVIICLFLFKHKDFF